MLWSVLNGLVVPVPGASVTQIFLLVLVDSYRVVESFTAEARLPFECLAGLSIANDLSKLVLTSCFALLLLILILVNCGELRVGHGGCRLVY